jgi:hypothetical protein
MLKKTVVIIVSILMLILSVSLIILLKQRRDKINLEFDKIEKQLETVGKASDFSYHLTTSKKPDVILQSKKALKIIEYISEMKSKIYEEINYDSLNNAVDSNYVLVVKSTHLELKKMLLDYKAFVEMKFPGTIKKEHDELNCDDLNDGTRVLLWEEYYTPEHMPLAAILGHLGRIKNDLKKIAKRIDERDK